MDTILKDKKTFFIFIAPAMLVFLFSVLVPIIWSLYYSFHRWNGITPMRYIGLDNFIRLFTRDTIFFRAFLNNLLFVTISVTLKVVLGIMGALLLLQLTKGRDLFKTLVFIPTLLSTVVLAQLFLRIYSYHPVGLLNYLLQMVGLGHMTRAWLSDINLALYLLIVIDVYRYLPIYIIIYYTAFISIPTQVIEAAMIDGVRWWRMLRNIRIPMIKGVFAATLVMLIAGTLKEFDLPYVLTYGGPAYRTEMVSTHMYKMAFSSLQYGYGSAIAFFLVIECLIIILLVRRFISHTDD